MRIQLRPDHTDVDIISRKVTECDGGACSGYVERLVCHAERDVWACISLDQRCRTLLGMRANHLGHADPPPCTKRIWADERSLLRSHSHTRGMPQMDNLFSRNASLFDLMKDIT